MNPRRRTSLALALLVMLVGYTFAGTEPVGPTTPAEPTPEAIQQRIEQVKANADLQEQAKQTLLETYQKALEKAQAAQEWSEKAEDLKQGREGAPQLVAELQAKLETEPEPVEITPLDEPVTRLQQELVKAQAELAEKKNLAAELEAEQSRRSERRKEAPTQAETARKALDEVEEGLSALPAEGLNPDQAARATLLRARKKALQAEMAALDEELLSYDARGELLNLRRQVTARELERAEKRVERWQKIVTEKRRQESEQAAREAAREAARAHPALKDLAERNKELAGLRAKTLTLRMEQTSTELEAVKLRLTNLKDDLKKVRDKVEKAGMSKELGLRLRKVKAELPDIRAHRNKLNALQPKIAEAQLNALDYREEAAEAYNVEARLQEIMDALGPEMTLPEREEIRGTARNLLETRRDLLTALHQDYDSYFVMLLDLAEAERQLIQTSSEYRSFISRNILWYRSSSHLGPRALRQTAHAAGWLTNLENWRKLGGAILSDARARPTIYALGLLVFAALLYLRPHFRKALHQKGELAQNIETDSIMHTLAALVLTLLLTASWPWLLCSLGWLLSAAPRGGEFTQAVGTALVMTGLAMYSLEAIRVACVDGGLGAVHFRTRASAGEALRKNLNWLLPVILPVVFLVVVTEQHSAASHNESLGRLAFIAGQIALAVFVQRVLRRKDGMLQDVLARRQGGWLDRLSPVWHPLAVAVPLALAVLAGLGYYYTAQMLAWRLAISFWLFLGLVVIYELLLRWLFVARRKMALQEARKRREAEEADEQAPPELVGAEFETPQMSIHAIGRQSRQLLASLFGVALVAMLWLIWRDIVPALAVLGDIALGGDPVITLGSVGLALLVVIITIIAAKNIPGLMEIAVLQHLPLDAAVRFAISKISRYTITIVGIIVAFNAVGIGWAKVQWLAAAVSVGLGFGLQEIFANFVSGLIILFERPIRVGDTVTVGDVTGTVTRIRIRATTITNWDRKELVVPNREFITGRLINWSLSDQILRIIIPVGIAYGSDTELAERTLHQVARENATLVDDPPPTVVFIGFGDSSLNFELRVFVPDIESFIKVRHQLHMAIDREFREAGIEIAFPQQDVHIRSIKAALPIVRQDNTKLRQKE